MPMYWDAYLADTTHLTTEEHGAYMLLLAAMWRRNGSVPDDDRDNARILGLTPAKWRKIKSRFIATVSGFVVENDAITQEKLKKTWEITQEKIDKNKRNGAKGGRASASKNNSLDEANAVNPLERKVTIPEPEPEPYIKKEDTNVSLSLDMPDDTQIAFDEFNAMAGEIGLPVAKVLSKKRKTALKGRLSEAGGIDGWRAALEKVRASPLCTGDNQRGWVADLDFILQQKSFIKLMEGSYDARNGTNNTSQQRYGSQTAGERVDASLENAANLFGVERA